MGGRTARGDEGRADAWARRRTNADSFLGPLEQLPTQARQVPAESGKRPCGERQMGLRALALVKRIEAAGLKEGLGRIVGQRLEKLEDSDAGAAAGVPAERNSSRRNIGQSVGAMVNSIFAPKAGPRSSG